MAEYQFSGPRIARTAASESSVRARAHQLIRAIAEEKHRQAVARWAADNSGQFPTRSQAEQEAIAEFQVLCRGLDGWAAVDPDTVLGPLYPHPGWLYD